MLAIALLVSSVSSFWGSLQQEDAGETISHNTNLIPPDYRLLLPGNNEFFVEVKNVHDEDPSSQFSFRQDYLTSLASYANAFDRPLKFAIYWSRWNKWTLIASDKLPVRSGKRSISMIEAVKMNEMAILGDITLGTKVPLTFRLVANPSKPASIMADGEANFTIERTEIYCAGGRVHGADAKLAWYMMLHGKWSELEQIPLVEGERLIALDNVISPEMWEPEQGFAFIGDLSGMISDQYKHHTSPEGKIKLIRPLAEPNTFGVAIPEDHSSENLPLWRFVLQPNYD